MPLESQKNITDVAKAESWARIFSDIQTKPTSTLPPMPRPATKVTKRVSFKLADITIIRQEIKCIRFPIIISFLRPWVSLILGIIRLPRTSPMKKEVPKTPKSCLGEHSMSNRWIQLWRFLGESGFYRYSGRILVPPSPSSYKFWQKSTLVHFFHSDSTPGPSYRHSYSG